MHPGTVIPSDETRSPFEKSFEQLKDYQEGARSAFADAWSEALIVSEGVHEMPAPHAPEFRRRALDLVARGNPMAQTARDIGSASRVFGTG